MIIAITILAGHVGSGTQNDRRRVLARLGGTAMAGFRGRYFQGAVRKHKPGLLTMISSLSLQRLFLPLGLFR